MNFENTSNEHNNNSNSTKQFQPMMRNPFGSKHINKCEWPIGHPDEEKFYFCGRKPIEDFPYCKLHVLYAFQPKHPKEELTDKDEEMPAFLEKKIKSAG